MEHPTQLESEYMVLYRAAPVPNNLAITYMDRIQGEPSQNLELAIASFQRASEVLTVEVNPLSQARTANNLAAGKSTHWKRKYVR